MSKGVFQGVRGSLGDDALTHLAPCSIVWGGDISVLGRGLGPDGHAEDLAMGGPRQPFSAGPAALTRQTEQMMGKLEIPEERGEQVMG